MKILKNLIRQKRGFTLTEVQVSLFITVIILLAAITLYITYWRTFLADNAYLDIYSNSRMAMDYMIRDIRSASLVAQQYPPTGGATYRTSSDTLVLMVPSIDGSGNVIPSQNDYIVYTLKPGNKLYRIVYPTGGPKPSFRRSDNRAIARYLSSSAGQSLSFSTDLTPQQKSLSDPSVNLSTLNTVGIVSPLNQTITSMSGTGTISVYLAPTTVIRLRNKSQQ